MNLRLIAAGLLIFPTLLDADDWPAFRGPTGTGVSTEEKAPLKWDADTNVKWKVALPMPANGSPIVSNGRVFTTTPDDAEGRNRSLHCFDRRDGKKLWSATVEFGKKMPTHKTNPYGGSTPAADGKHVVVWHASAGLYCYDFDGKELWRRDLGEFKHMWGYGTSPVLYKDRVILYSGPGKKIWVAAFDLDSGKTLWQKEEKQDGDGEKRSDGGYLGSWTTPVIVKDRVLVYLPTRIVAYDPENGDILWFSEGIKGPRGDLAYSSPMVSGDVCVAIAGYQGPGIAVKLGGEGDVTKTHRVWSREKTAQNIGTGVIVGDHLYLPGAGPAIIECIDMKTGETVWKKRTGRAPYWGSMILAAGRIYVTNQEGTTLVLKPNPEKLEILAENKLAERTNSTPAVSDGEVFLQTHKHLYCIK